MALHRTGYLALAFSIVAFGPALAIGQADKRSAGTDPNPKTHYCVRNAEGGACEDCWSDQKGSSDGGTCQLLKDSTNNPNVRKGSCSQFEKTDFCKKK